MTIGLINSYFSLGVHHILDIEGFDHMLFVSLLVSGFPLGKWRNLLWTITAFTIGHSLTLILAVLGINPISLSLVEFFIPITIALTATSNLLLQQNRFVYDFGTAAIFGMIHGLGFAGYLGQLMPKDASSWKPLLFFNLGVEAGQIVIAATVLLVLWGIRLITKDTVHIAQKVISIVGLGISLFLAIQNWP